MFYELEFRAFFLFNFLGWISLLLLASGVSAKSPSMALHPRFLPREQLTTLPLVIRGSPDAQAKVIANATITNNSTLPNITQANAGWSAVTQATDKQCVAPVLLTDIRYLKIAIPPSNTQVVLRSDEDWWHQFSACARYCFVGSLGGLVGV
jgi:hypothetical protein